MSTSKRLPNTIIVLTLSAVVLALDGCATGMQTRAVSSVYDYLYPKKEGVIEQPGIPLLKPPVKVGIAFVPEGTRHGGYNFWTGSTGDAGFSESDKTKLLQRIADHFRTQPIVGSIEIIPSAYLTPGGSFANLQQLKTMYGVDLIALVSYDQVQFTDEGVASFAYWTIVGAYVVQGEKNETKTMVDTVVYDIESRKMLFRAPGTSQVKSHATPVNLSQELRKNGGVGMEQAADAMIVALDEQLVAFKQRVKERPEEFRVAASSSGGGGGGGSTGLEMLAGLALLALWRVRRRPQRA